MTDNEIINDFEKEIKYVKENEKYDDFNPIVDIDLCENILDLINRQKAEIERLQKEIEVKDNIYQRNTGLRKKRIFDLIDELKKAKSEAIKEFAERLKEEMSCEDDCGYHCSDCCYECKDYVPVINNVLREMEK